jgi:DNA topoisomerase VI subunit B
MYDDDDDDDVVYAAKFTAKRYRTYLKEEQERKKKNRDSQWINSIIVAVFWLLKLITSGLERVNIKRQTVIEKVLVE